MKKHILFILSVVLLAACTKDFEEQNTIDSSVFYAVMENDTDTKVHLNESLKTRWDADDRVTVFAGTTYNREYKFNGSIGASDGELVPVGNAGSGSSISANYAVYPYMSSIGKASTGDNIGLTLPETQSYAPNSYGKGANIMVAVTASTDDLNFLFKNICGYLKVSLYGNATVRSIKLEGNNSESLAGKSTAKASLTGEPSVSVMGNYGKPAITLDCGDGVALGSSASSATDFYFVVPPVRFTKGFTITVTLSDGSTFEKSTDKSIKITRNKIQKMAAVLVETESETVDELVDLGLSVKWRSWNLGATKPEEYGDYYAWGATEPWYKDGYSQETPGTHWKSGKTGGYTWNNTPYQVANSANSTFESNTLWTKYLGSTTSSLKDDSATNADAVKIILDFEDDAARDALGDGWRMPTYEEWLELRNTSNCTWTWTTYNGVDGYKVQSNKAGYTDKWIFLPASGWRSGSVLEPVGSNSDYWSSSLNLDDPKSACSVYFNSSTITRLNNYRYCGVPVRPVHTDDQSSGITGISLNKTSVTLDIALSETLIATVSKKTGAVNNQVEWSSSDPSVATVDYSGNVNAVASGTATITAKTVFGGFTATCSITVNAPTVSATDLSASGTANSYIVSSAGTYMFEAVKGNSSTAVGTVASVEVLWESFGTDTAPSVGDLIDNVNYASNNNYISFTATSKKGNAVIAAKDSSGEILWSWHIWLTDEPEDQVYKNNAGTMMDRNLGATSATPGDVQALGLLYQWGRKDPFLGSSSITSSKNKAVSTGSWPSDVTSDSSKGTIAYAVSHPTTFISENYSSNDWIYSGSSPDYNARWQASNSDKSVYDPCPPGYRVPDGGDSGVWAKALGTSSECYEPWDSTNKGMNFGGTNKKLGTSPTIWYPAAGDLYASGGTLFDVGDGHYWSASLSLYGVYYFCITSRSSVYPASKSRRAYGYSVRCARE